MYSFIFIFILFYFQFSVICLIKDIFWGNKNLIKYNLETTVNNYRKTFNLNYNNLINLIPYFITLDIIYSSSDDYNYFRAFFQIFLQIYYSYFMYKFVCMFRQQKENNNMVCVYNILSYNIKDIYLFYLFPMSFLPFFIGLNKLTIDIYFNICLLYIFFKNSNIQQFINITKMLDIYLKIYEFDNRITCIFYSVSDKCSDIEFLNSFYNSLSNHDVSEKEIKNDSNEIINDISINTSKYKSSNISSNSSINSSSNTSINTSSNTSINTFSNTSSNTSSNTFSNIFNNIFSNINENEKKNI